MSRITSRLMKSLAVTATAVLVFTGGGVAFADDSPSPAPTSAASAASDSDADAKAAADKAAADAKAKAEKEAAEKAATEKAKAEKAATEKAKADKAAADAKAKADKEAADKAAAEKAKTKEPAAKVAATEAELITVTAVKGRFNDSCGAEVNAEFEETPTEGVRYVVTRDGSTFFVHAEVTDSSKYVLSNPDWEQMYTDQQELCVDETITVSPVPPVVTPLCGTTDSVKLADQPEGIVLLNAGEWVKQADGTYVRTVSYGVAKGYSLPDDSDGTFRLVDKGEACATTQQKAFICKYVGHGADERLQTGDNPVFRDRKDWMVIGSFFNDAQGRSVVIAFGNPGDPEPSISACPAPPETPNPVVTTSTETRDDCTISEFIQTRTVTTTRSYTWQGTKGWVLGDPVVTYGGWTNTDKPATNCQAETITVSPVPPVVTPLCGTTDSVKLADQPEGIVLLNAGEWVKQADGTYVRTVSYGVAKGYSLPDDSDGTFRLVDKGEACPVEVVIHPQGSLKLTCNGGSVNMDNSKSNTEVGYELVVVYPNGTGEFYQYVLKGGEKLQLPLPALPAGTKVFLNAADTDLASVTAPDNCTVVPPKPPVTHQCPNGTDVGDRNGDGKVDAKDCKATSQKPTEKPKPTVKPSKPIVNAGVDASTSTPVVSSGFGFNTATAGIALAMAFLAALVVEVLRRRRTNP